MYVPLIGRSPDRNDLEIRIAARDTRATAAIAIAILVRVDMFL